MNFFRYFCRELLSNYRPMAYRKIEQYDHDTTTSAFSGIFLKSQKTRNEFLKLIEK